MIIAGVTYLTAKDAALFFGVTQKTVHEWIRNGVIERPPTIRHGLKEIRVFTEEYLKRAKHQLEVKQTSQASTEGG